MNDQCGMDDSPLSGEGMGGETGKGVKELLGGNGFIELESHYLKITQTELKIPSQLIILFLSLFTRQINASNKWCVSPSLIPANFLSIRMIHADN